MRPLAGPKTTYRRADATPLAELILDGVQYRPLTVEKWPSDLRDDVSQRTCLQIPRVYDSAVNHRPMCFDWKPN